MRSPGRARGRGREARNRGGRRLEGRRVKGERSRPGRSPKGVTSNIASNSNRVPIGRRSPGHPPVHERTLLPPRDRSPLYDEDVHSRSRGRNEASPRNTMQDLREKLSSTRAKNQDRGSAKRTDETENRKRRDSGGRREKEKAHSSSHVRKEEGAAPAKKRSPARPPSPPEEPSVTSTVHNSDVELDYDYEPMGEEIESPERKPNLSPRNESFADDRKGKGNADKKSPVRRKVKQEESVERKKVKKEVKREVESGSDQEEDSRNDRKRSVSPKRVARHVSNSPSNRRRRSPSEEVRAPAKAVRRSESPPPREGKARDWSSLERKSPSTTNGRPPREVRAPRDGRDRDMMRSPPARARGQLKPSMTPSLSPPKHTPPRQVVGVPKKAAGSRAVKTAAKDRRSPGGRRVGPPLKRERSPPPPRGRSPRNRGRLTPPHRRSVENKHIPSLLDVRLNVPDRRMSPRRRTPPPRRVSPGRRFSPPPHRRVSPMHRLSPPPGRRVSPGPPRGRRVSPGPAYGGFRDDRPEWREFSPRAGSRGRLLPPHPERFREPSPRFHRRPLTPEWERRRPSPEMYPPSDIRFEEPIERFHDGPRLLPHHPNERRLVRTSRHSPMPEPEWADRYVSPRREVMRAPFPRPRSFSRSPVHHGKLIRPYPLPPPPRPLSRSPSPAPFRRRSLERSPRQSPVRSRSRSEKRRHRSRSPVGSRSESRGEKVVRKKSGVVKEKKKKDKDAKKSDGKKSKEKKASKKVSSKPKPKKVKKKKEELKKKKKKTKKEESSSESSSSDSSSSSESQSETTGSESSEEETQSKKKTKKTGKKKAKTPIEPVEEEVVTPPKEAKTKPTEPLEEPVVEKVPQQEFDEDSESEHSTSGALEPRENEVAVFSQRVGLEAALGPDKKTQDQEVLTITKPCNKEDTSSWRDKEPKGSLSERFARCSRINPRPRAELIEEPLVLKVTMKTDRTQQGSAASARSGVIPPIPVPAIPPNWEDANVRLAYYTALGFLPKGSSFEEMRIYELERVGMKPPTAAARGVHDRHQSSEEDYTTTKAPRQSDTRPRKEKRKSESESFLDKKRKY